jgi:hypothetical protein
VAQPSATTDSGRRIHLIHWRNQTCVPPFRPALAVLLAASAAQAQTPAPAVRTEKNISLALANQIAAEAVAACAANGYNVAATVVDRAGTVRAVQRADNAGPHTLASSERKAWTSASAKSPTQAMMEGAQKNPAPRTSCTCRASCCWAAACR